MEVMKIDISSLPANIKLEVTKADLIAFANALVQAKVEQETPVLKEEEDIVDFDKALAILGYASPTLYAKTSRGEIPHYKRGRKLFFRKSELISWIEKGKIKTTKDIDDIAKNYLLKIKETK